MRVALIPMMILSFCTIFLKIYASVNHILPYRQASINYVCFNNLRPDFVTHEYIKEEINKIFKCNYVLKFKDLNEKYCSGYSYIMLKIVVIDNNLSLEEFAMTLAHELVHITYFTTNERFTSFKAFQILYKSGNEYLKNVALAFANNDFKGKTPKEYSCAGYLETYLRMSGII